MGRGSNGSQKVAAGRRRGSCCFWLVNEQDAEFVWNLSGDEVSYTGLSGANALPQGLKAKGVDAVGSEQHFGRAAVDFDGEAFILSLFFDTEYHDAAVRIPEGQRFVHVTRQCDAFGSWAHEAADVFH